MGGQRADFRQKATEHGGEGGGVLVYLMSELRPAPLPLALWVITLESSKARLWAVQAWAHRLPPP